MDLQKGFSRASSWAGLERTFRHSFCTSLTALATARDHEDRESALQKTSTKSGLAMKASTFLRHRNDQEAMQNHTLQSKNADFSSKRTSFNPPPSQTNIVRLKQNAGNWRRPLIQATGVRWRSPQGSPNGWRFLPWPRLVNQFMKLNLSPLGKKSSERSKFLNWPII